MQVTVEAPLAAVLLPGLWTEADDQGVFPWKPITLKARILPATNADVAELLGVLERHEFVARFTSDGKEYGAIRNFRRWQRPKRPTASHPLPEEYRSYVGLKGGDGEHVGEGFGTQGGIAQQREDVGEEVIGGEEGESNARAQDASLDASAEQKPEDPKTWPPPETMPEWAKMDALQRQRPEDGLAEDYDLWRQRRLAAGIVPQDPRADWNSWLIRGARMEREQQAKALDIPPFLDRRGKREEPSVDKLMEGL